MRLRDKPLVRRVWLTDVERHYVSTAGVLVRGDEVAFVQLAPATVNAAVCPSHAVVLPPRLGRRLLVLLQAAQDEINALRREDFSEPWLAREREQARPVARSRTTGARVRGRRAPTSFNDEGATNV